MGGGDLYDLYHPLKIHVPKYQIKFLQNQKWQERVVNEGLGWNALLGVLWDGAPQNGGFSCVPNED